MSGQCTYPVFSYPCPVCLRPYIKCNFHTNVGNENKLGCMDVCALARCKSHFVGCIVRKFDGKKNKPSIVCYRYLKYKTKLHFKLISILLAPLIQLIDSLHFNRRTLVSYDINDLQLTIIYFIKDLIVLIANQMHFVAQNNSFAFLFK